MCMTCEKAAQIVSDSVDGKLSVEEVRVIAGAFNRAAEAVAIEEMDAAFGEYGEPVVEEREVVIVPGAAGQEAIPSVILEALVASVGGPVVVIGATLAEDGNSLMHLKAAGTRDAASLAKKLCRVALDTLESPLAETGGFTEDGRLIMPMWRASA